LQGCVWCGVCRYFYDSYQRFTGMRWRLFWLSE
jgi:hypothetical protein